MYYWGSDEWYPFTFTSQIGMAVSMDGGQSWLKYDDPATTNPPFAESDPVLKSGPESYDADGIWGAGIVRDSNQWEMFYAGDGSSDEGAICYATSVDGIHWTKYSGNPIFTFWEDPLAAYAFLETPTVAVHNSTYFLFYDYGNGPNSAGIGLAADPPIIGIEQPVGNNISDYKIYQNYPNPFNPSTTIIFQIPRSGFVTLKIYNLLGEEVGTLISGQLLSGSHSVKWDASGMASGIYLYKLETESYWAVKKLVLLK